MNHLYAPMLVVHVIVAVLGVGSIAAIALVAATARRVDDAAVQVSAWLAPLLRYSAFSLAVMLMTGILLDLAAHDAFRRSWWFRGSALLLVATGVLHGWARRAVRRGVARNSGGTVTFRYVERIAYGMCALIAVITMLMEVKPF
jgi:hypothetical protein